MMNDKKAERIAKLKKEQALALQELEYLRESLRSEVDLDLDEADPHVTEREMAMVVIIDLERKLKAINYALRQLEAGTYGICERCGQPIDPARLEVIPETTLCIKCKTIVERERKSNQKIYYNL
jgi:DnaK suppressor protein